MHLSFIPPLILFLMFSLPALAPICNDNGLDCPNSTDPSLDFLCDSRQWACDNGIIKNASDYPNCEKIEVFSSLCYSDYDKKHYCFSSGSRWYNQKPEGCKCTEYGDFECREGRCINEMCVAFIPPSLYFDEPYDVITVELDSSKEINLTLVNEHSVPDIITINLSDSGDVHFRDGSTGLFQDVSPESSTEIPIVIDGSSIFFKSFTVRARSSLTELSSELQFTVNVPPASSQIGRAPDISHLNLAIIALLGAGLFLIYTNAQT